MLILRNHYNTNNTYIVGDVIVNGCQVFHISKLSSICEKFRVPENIKDQVLVAHRGNSHIPEEYDKLVRYENRYIRAAVAATGIKKYCNMLITDKDWYVRAAVCVTRIKEYLDILVTDKDIFVRTATASVVKSL